MKLHFFMFYSADASRAAVAAPHARQSPDVQSGSCLLLGSRRPAFLPGSPHFAAAASL